MDCARLSDNTLGPIFLMCMTLKLDNGKSAEADRVASGLKRACLRYLGTNERGRKGRSDSAVIATHNLSSVQLHSP